MRYAAARPDGGVSIITCNPVKAVSPEAKEFKVEGFKRLENHAVLFLRNDEQTGELRTSQEFHADGWTITFMDPLDLVAKHQKRAEMLARMNAIDDPVERERALAKAPMIICSDDVLTITPLADADIPPDRTFRDGWKVLAGKIDHDMPKCREIHKERLREARAPQLTALDVEFMRAVERGDSAAIARIGGDKQKLRDVTDHPDIASAKTPDELKAVWPL